MTTVSTTYKEMMKKKGMVENFKTRMENKGAFDLTPNEEYKQKKGIPSVSSV